MTAVYKERQQYSHNCLHLEDLRDEMLLWLYCFSRVPHLSIVAIDNNIFSLLHQKPQSLSHRLLMLSCHVVPSLSVSPALSHRDESTILHELHTDRNSSQAATQTRLVQCSHVLTLAGVLGISNSFS